MKQTEEVCECFWRLWNEIIAYRNWSQNVLYDSRRCRTFGRSVATFYRQILSSVALHVQFPSNRKSTLCRHIQQRGAIADFVILITLSPQVKLQPHMLYAARQVIASAVEGITLTDIPKAIRLKTG
jgi:hypothetical protein